MNTINIRTEYNLMNVEVSEDFRHFGGKLDPHDDQEFSRIFAVLIDDNTGKQLETLGFDYSIIRVRNSEVDRSFRYSLMIRVDYDICKPNIAGRKCISDGTSKKPDLFSVSRVAAGGGISS